MHSLSTIIIIIGSMGVIHLQLRPTRTTIPFSSIRPQPLEAGQSPFVLVSTITIICTLNNRTIRLNRIQFLLLLLILDIRSLSPIGGCGDGHLQQQQNKYHYPRGTHSLSPIGVQRDGHNEQHTHKYYIHPSRIHSLSFIGGRRDDHLQQQQNK